MTQRLSLEVDLIYTDLETGLSARPLVLDIGQLSSELIAVITNRVTRVSEEEKEAIIEGRENGLHIEIDTKGGLKETISKQVSLVQEENNIRGKRVDSQLKDRFLQLTPFHLNQEAATKDREWFSKHKSLEGQVEKEGDYPDLTGTLLKEIHIPTKAQTVIEVDTGRYIDTINPSLYSLGCIVSQRKECLF